MASPRLVKFAQYVAAGDRPAVAARKAGFAPSTSEVAKSRLVPKAVAEGLLPDPEAHKAKVAEAEEILANGVPKAAKALVDRSPRDTSAAREVLNRTMGPVEQRHRMTITDVAAVVDGLLKEAAEVLDDATMAKLTERWREYLSDRSD